MDKFDALMAKYQPQEVSFFGSSMGGDVVAQPGRPRPTEP